MAEDTVATPETIVVVQGDKLTASAKGVDSVAVAVGDYSRAQSHFLKGSHKGCAVAVGSPCQAEVFTDDACGIAAVAVGICAEATSHDSVANSVAIGYSVFAEWNTEGGNAIAIGSELNAQAGEGGYLVFVDTSDGEPQVRVFRVDPALGIWPGIPYRWEPEWPTPCPDDERMDRLGPGTRREIR